MPRILFVLPTLAHCGMTRQAAQLAAGLPRDRFDLRVCALSREGPAADTLRAAGVPVEPLGPARLVNLGTLFRLRQLVADHRPDVIHTWGPSSLRAVALAGTCGRLLASQPLPIRERPAWPGRLDRWFFRRVDGLLARGHAEAERWRRLGLPAGRIRVVSPGIEAAPFPQIEPPPLRNRYLACVGSLESHKGYLDAIWTFDILHFVYEDLRLVLVGTGPDRERLERFAEAIQARQRVHFVDGHGDRRSWLAGAEVVWVPSRADTGLHTALEAMAVGRPVIASRQPGLSEIVADGETGFLVAPGDKMELARRTRELLEDAALRRRLGEAGRRRAAACFAAGDFLRTMAELYLGREAA